MSDAFILFINLLLKSNFPLRINLVTSFLNLSHDSDELNLLAALKYEVYYVY